MMAEVQTAKFEVVMQGRSVSREDAISQAEARFGKRTGGSSDHQYHTFQKSEGELRFRWTNKPDFAHHPTLPSITLPGDFVFERRVGAK